jgi:hypothetical protein
MNGLTKRVSVHRRVRLLGLGALIAAAALALSLSALSASARAAKPHPTTTIVLVHGAFASPAGWDGVADALHKDGYQTAAPALGLTSVAGDVAIVRSTLDSIPGDKILCPAGSRHPSGADQRRRRSGRERRTGRAGSAP